MLFVELFVPKGTLSERARLQVCERLVTAVVSAPGAPASIIEAARAISHVVVNEPETWIVGAQPFAQADLPRYVVRVSLPSGHLTEAKSAEIIKRVTSALAEVDADPQRLYEEPIAWVHVIGVPEGSCGTFGRIMRTPDITKLVLESGHDAAQWSTPADTPASRTAIDPICGMTVALDTAVILEYGGTRLAFCCMGCRDAFEAQRTHSTPE